MTEPIAIRHNSEAQRFEVLIDGLLAVCEYRRQGHLLVLPHTGVPSALQGRGIAAQLVQAVLDWARAEGLKVRPVCSYVAAYLRRHPESADLLAV